MDIVQQKERITARQDAVELVAMATEQVSENYRAGFAVGLREMADIILGPVETGLRIMSDKEAADFERKMLKFGIHRDQPIGHVPIGYLTWIADANLELQAYLRSSVGKRRIELDV